MKTLKPILATAACAAFAFTLTTTPIHAAEQAKEHKEGAHHVAIPADANGILQEIHKYHGQISELVKAKNLAGVHEHSEAITALAKALAGKVPIDKKGKVQGAVTHVEKAADALHHAADGKDQAGSEAKLKNLDTAIGQLEKQAK